MMNQSGKNSLQNMSRACVFIDSSNPSMPYQVIDNKIHPLIKLPFPPLIDPVDLIAQRSNSNNIPARAPNAFIIYRKAFIDAAHADGYHLPMRIMSSMASQSWDQEPDKVKTEYRRLANEAFNLRNEMYPKSGCKRKRAKWNIVSFKNKSKITKKRQKWNIVSFDQNKSNSSQDNDKSIETNKSVQQSSTKLSFTSSISQDKSNKEACSSNFNNIFPSPEMNFDMSNDINEIPSNNVFNQNFTYQDMIPSPELSITSSLSPESFEQIENDFDFDFCYPEQPLNGVFNQNDDQFNFQIKNDNLFDYYQNPEFNNNQTFACDNENLLNENISSQEYLNGFQSSNFQSSSIESIESNALYLYDSANYFSDGLGISNSYFQY